MRRNLVLLFSPFLLTMLASSLQGAPIDPKDYDANGDGQLSGAERKIFLIHKNSIIHHKYDANKNGVLDPAERTKWDADIATQVAMDETDVTGEHVPRQTLSLEDERITNKARVDDIPSDFDFLGGIQIRRSLEDVDPFWTSHTVAGVDNYQEILEKIPPAIFSYSRDLNKDSDTWTAHGVVARAFDLSHGEGTLMLLPSISFDRVDTSANGTTEEENALAFRMGFVGDLIQYSSKGEDAGKYTFRLEARANAVYSTDFDFDRSVWGGELELEPVLTTPAFALHIFRELGPVFWRPTAFLHAEFGSIEESLAVPNADSGYFRLGPQLGVEITPNLAESNPLSFLNRRLLLDAAFAYYWDLRNSEDIQYFRGGVNWLLDERGHVKLTAEYQRGSLQFDSQDVDIFTVGLGVAF